jgi:hypothetical protein
MTIIDSQVHACEANTPKRPRHSVPKFSLVGLGVESRGMRKTARSDRNRIDVGCFG